MICFITEKKTSSYGKPWKNHHDFSMIFLWFFSPGGVNQGGDLQCEGIATATEIGTDLSTVLGYPV